MKALAKASKYMYKNMISIVVVIFLFFIGKFILYGMDTIFLIITFILIGLSLFYFKMIKDRKKLIKVFTAILVGIISLQGAWPVFSPRISVENYDTLFGVYDVMSGEKHIAQRAIITVAPPLFPVIDSANYAIAKDLREVREIDENLHLKVNKFAASDTDISITLKKITGWTWTETKKRIEYISSSEFETPIQNKIIDKVYLTDNSQAPTSFYSKDYRYFGLAISNNNKFLTYLKNINLSLNDNSEAWLDLSKWVQEGSCISAYYSDSTDYSKYGPSARILYNPPYKSRYNQITSDMLSQKNITIVIDIYELSPNSTSYIDIVFKKFSCPPPQIPIPYTLSGQVKIEGKPSANRTVALENLNTTDEDFFKTDENGSYIFELANLPNGYSFGDIIKISVCEKGPKCSKQITTIQSEGAAEINFDL